MTNTGTGGSTAAQTAGVSTALTSNGFTKVGYHFTGWNTAADGTGTTYADGALYAFSAGAINLYAQWTINIVVTGQNFNTNKAGDYYGPTVGFALAGTGVSAVTSIKVELFSSTDGSGTPLVANNSKVGASINVATSYSSAFPITTGTYSTSSTWSFGSTAGLVSGTKPQSAVITVTDAGGATYTTMLSSLSEATATWASLFDTVTLTGQNFNTNKGLDYYGPTVGFALAGSGVANIASISVALMNGGTTLVTNTSKSASVVNVINSYSSAFPITTGTYSTSSTWNFGSTAGLVSTTVPTSAVITVVELSGMTYTATISSLSEATATWASLFEVVAPVPSYSPGFTPLVQATFVVTPAATTIQLTKTTTLTTSGGSGTGVVTYTTSTPTICSVSSAGVVTGIAVGSCYITATKAADASYTEVTSSPITITVSDSDAVAAKAAADAAAAAKAAADAAAAKALADAAAKAAADAAAAKAAADAAAAAAAGGTTTGKANINSIRYAIATKTKTIFVDMADMYANQIAEVSVKVYTVKNGKKTGKYVVVETVALDEAGVAKIKTLLKLKVGDVIRVSIDGTVIKSVTIK